MYRVREVLNCRPGLVRELVDKFTRLGKVMEEHGAEPFRIMTDVSGEHFWTLVLESDYETLDDIPATEAKVMSDERAREIMEGYHELVRSGRREIYRIEA
jgi:hypothetical protein